MDQSKDAYRPFRNKEHNTMKKRFSNASVVMLMTILGGNTKPLCINTREEPQEE